MTPLGPDLWHVPAAPVRLPGGALNGNAVSVLAELAARDPSFAVQL